MKKILSLFAVTAYVILPAIAFGQNGGGLAGGEFGTENPLGEFLSTTLGFINSVLIPFILAVGFLVFVWGVFQFFILGGSNDEAKESGKSLIMYAIAGFVIILAFWGIVNLLSGFLGFEGDNLDNIPAAGAL